MMLTSSPYTVSRPPPPERFIPRWDAEGREVVPQLVEALVDTSRRPVAVIANHGMGKTTVAEAVARAIGTAAHLIPIDCKMERVTEPVTWLKNVLGATQGTWLEAAAAACEAGPVGLWFDEVDVWCRDADGVEPTRRLFSLLKSAQEHVAQLRVIVTGGVGVLTLDQPFGSGMVGRMTTMTLRPFDLDDIDTMIAWDPSPAWRSRVHPWREAILTFSGGCPRLVVSALDHFWVHGAASVETLMRESLASDAHYVRQVLEAVGKGNEKLSPVYDLLLDVCRAPGPTPLMSLPAAERLRSGAVGSTPETAAQVLAASGLIDQSHADGIWYVARRAGVLTDSLAGGFNQAAEQAALDRLAAALRNVLGAIHRNQQSMRYGKGPARQRLEEGTWSSMVAVGLIGAGWETTCEPVSGGGRADLRVILSDGAVVIEVKRGDNKDLPQLTEQMDRQDTVDVLARWSITFGTPGETERWASATGLPAPGRRDWVTDGADAAGRRHWFVLLNVPRAVMG